MSAVSARADRLAMACARVHGESAVHTDSELTETACRCVLFKRSEPILRDGQITLAETHFQGYVPQTQVPTIADGDTLAVDGIGYGVDGVPELRDGMWVLRLRAR